MGCTQVTNVSIKNPRIKNFFDLCQYYGFNRSQVVKITEYQYQYCRGSKSWKSNYFKSIFNDQNPALLSPCLPDNFDNLIFGLTNFKQLYPEEFKDFPKNLGMLLSLGNKFPNFKAEKLGTNQITTFQIQQNEVTIFVFWKLEEEKRIGKMSLIKTRNVSNRFRDDDESQSYLETAFTRAKKLLKRPLNLIGICLDAQEQKGQYKQAISNEDTHIWINENDQSAQVFKFAEDPHYQIRQLEQSIYIVNSQGMFVGCLKENFGDPLFIHEINDLIDGEINQQSMNEINNIKQIIRKDDYQKVKRLIIEELPNRKNLPVGDTFSLSIKKHTYFRDYQKVGATYFNPVFKAAGSKKYQQNCDDLIQFVKEYTPIAHMETDFKQHHSVNKKQFFEKLSRKIINLGYDDFRFILEKSIEIFYDENTKRLEMKREITSIHNAPQSISCVYTRKESLQNLGKSIMAQSQNYTHKELELLKEFFGNPYALKTSFSIGTLFSPIPNVYKLQPNDFSGNSLIMQSVIRTSNKGIFDSKLVQSVNQSIDDQNQNFGITEQVKSNQSQFELSVGWDGDNKVDLNYDQIHTIRQLNNEVLIIFLIDYTLDKHIELLHQMLDYIKRNQWNSSNVRVIGLQKKRSEEQFQRQINKLEEEMKKGVFEVWFPLDQPFLGMNFYQIMSDLYGLDSISPILVIDHLGRLLFQGQPDSKFAPLLTKIINQDSLKTIHPVDRTLKHRIDLAQFGREWKIIKQYGNESVYFSQTVQQTQKYLEKMPLRNSEQWKIQITQFQLWNENGSFVRKCYEKPKIIYKFDRPELGVKFYNIVEEIQRLVGKERIEVIDLNVEIHREKNNLQGEQLIN